MDVIAYHKIGIKNVVATMGTAFTSNHNLLLKKSTKNYIFSFDNDEAGISATIKSGKAALSAEVKVKVAMPKGSKDIDEFLAKTSPEEVEANLAEAEDFISFLVDILFKASPTDPSFERIREVLSIVSKTNDELAKDYYVSKIANFYSIEKDVIATQLKNLTVKEHYEAEKKEIVKQRNSSDKVRINNLNARVLEQELEILSISLTDIEVFKVLQQNHYLFNSKLPKFFYNLIKANISDGVLNIEEIRKEIPKEDLLGAFNKLIITDDRETQIKIKELLLLINNTKDNVTELSKNNLLFEISNEDDPDKVDFLNKMLKEL
jgi:DNA primase